MIVLVLILLFSLGYLFRTKQNKKLEEIHALVDDFKVYLLVGINMKQKEKYIKKIPNHVIIQKYEYLYQTCAELFNVDKKFFSVFSKNRTKSLENHWCRLSPYEILRKMDGIFTNFHPYFWILMNFRLISSSLKTSNVIVPNIYFREEINEYIKHYGRDRVHCVLFVDNSADMKLSDVKVQHQFAVRNYSLETKTFDFDTRIIF
jgi:hypothetical protein